MLRGLLLGVYASLFVYGILDNSRGPLYPKFLEDLGLDYLKGSWFFSASSLASLISSLSVYFFIHRFGALRCLQSSMLMMAASFFILSQAHEFWGLISSAAIFGFSLGVAGVSQNVLIKEIAKAEHMRRVQSLFHTMYGISSLLAPLLVSVLISGGWDWRQTALFLAFLPVGGFIWIRFQKKTIAHENETNLKGFRAPFRWRTVGWAVFFGFYVSSELCLSTRIVVYLHRELQFDYSESNIYLSLFFVFLTLGRLSGSLFKFQQPDWVLVLASLGSSVFCYLAGMHIHPFFLSLTGLTMALVFPAAMTQVMGDYGQKETATVVSWIYISLSVFLSGMHSFFGFLAQSYGIGKALYFGWVCVTLATFLFWILSKRYRMGITAPVS